MSAVRASVPPAMLSTPAAARLVAVREIRERLRSKSFLISTGITLVIMLGAILIGSLVAANQQPTKVAVVGDPAVAGQEVRDLKSISVTSASDRAAAERLVRAGTVDAAIVADASGASSGVEVIAKTEAPSGLVDELSLAPKVTVLEPATTNPLIRYFVALGFGLVFFVSAMTFGSMIAQSVVEEKSTRIVEMLLAAVPARALLAGKVLGNSALAFGQILLYLGIGAIALNATGQTGLVASLGAPLLWFAAFFVVGFVLLASLFAATGAMVSRQEDVASTTMPVTMLVMLPYFLVIFFNDNPVVLTVMSYVPFSAPVGMPLRLFLGQAQWWEPLLALALLLVTCVGVIALGGRIYARSLLKLGARVPWREALRG